MRKAWILVEEKFPDYEVVFDPASGKGRIEVELTPEQVRLARKFEALRTRFEEMCEKLTHPDTGEEP